VKHLQIEVDDVEDENLLGEFEKTGSWIEEALKEEVVLEDGTKRKGRVLVHWLVFFYFFNLVDVDER
jgi:dual specificity phosphatase 12